MSVHEVMCLPGLERIIAAEPDAKTLANIFWPAAQRPSRWPHCQRTGVKTLVLSAFRAWRCATLEGRCLVRRCASLFIGQPDHRSRFLEL